MNKVEIRRNFHHLIDSIDNENLLVNFYELIKSRAFSKEGELWESLSLEEQNDLILSLEEIKNPDNLIPHNDIKKKHQKWL